MFEMGMMEHIISHSKQVCRVALTLVDILNQTQVQINRDLVQAAALLHDITKTRSFQTKEDHSLSGAAYLAHKGYPLVGTIVRQHVHLDQYLDTTLPSEAEIVNYADKRVLHERIVTLSERMQDLVVRYGKQAAHQQRILEGWKKTERLEQKLFQYISFKPETLILHVNHFDL